MAIEQDEQGEQPFVRDRVEHDPRRDDLDGDASAKHLRQHPDKRRRRQRDAGQIEDFDAVAVTEVNAAVRQKLDELVETFASRQHDMVIGVERRF